MSKNKAFYRGINNYRAAVVGKRTVPSSQVKYMLKSLGFKHVTTYATHGEYRESGKNIPYTHVLFDAREEDSSVPDFVEEALSSCKGAILIAISAQPRIDNVFELLRRGARGFLVTPLNMDMVEEVLLEATEGAPFSELILKAENRNDAFAELILNHVYRLAVAYRHSREREVPSAVFYALHTQLQESVEMAKLFCEHSEQHLKESIVQACIRRADDEKTKLSRLRKSLRAQRKNSAELSST